MFAHFLLFEGTGEAMIQPSAARFGSILSVENRAGAPSKRSQLESDLRLLVMRRMMALSIFGRESELFSQRKRLLKTLCRCFGAD